jgi:hypothetical protein
VAAYRELAKVRREAHIYERKGGLRKARPADSRSRGTLTPAAAFNSAAVVGRR